MTDLQRGQVELPLVVTHLKRQDEWNRFLQVGQGLTGRDRSIGEMME